MSTPNATASAPTVPLPAAVRRAVTIGLPVALLSAAILSFQGLYSLARDVGWSPKIAWLLPVSVDVAAAIATVVWLGSPREFEDVRRHAAKIALTAIGMSIVGNGGAHLIEAGVLEVTPTVIVIVTSIPPIVVALLVHLAMSLPQLTAAPATEDTGPEPEAEPEPEPEPAAERQRTVADAVAIATAMLEAEKRAGRDPDKLTSTPLARELGCTGSYARWILRVARGKEPMQRSRRRSPAAEPA